MEKRGQQMTLGTIILIVLGIAVLVFLIYGFSTGWSNLWDRVTAFSGKSNIDTIKQACALACTSNSEAAFCSDVRMVKYGSKVNAWNGSAVVEGVSSSPGTCKNMTDGTKYPGVGVSPCPPLC
jgi:hypothetical protein